MPEYDLKAIGNNLKRYRKAKYLSVDDVRQYMGLSSVQAVYKWESGAGLPSADKFFALLELYEVEPAEIIVKSKKSIFKEMNEKYTFLLEGPEGRNISYVVI